MSDSDEKLHIQVRALFVFISIQLFFFFFALFRTARRISSSFAQCTFCSNTVRVLKYYVEFLAQKHCLLLALCCSYEKLIYHNGANLTHFQSWRVAWVWTNHRLLNEIYKELAKTIESNIILRRDSFVVFKLLYSLGFR